MNEQILKGDPFLNRYRIEGTLTTISPLHVGNGAEVERKGLNAPDNKTANPATPNEPSEKPVKISAIATDYQNAPMIPGSSIKGAVRSYLLQVMTAAHVEKEGSDIMAADRNYSLWKKEHPDQTAQIDAMRTKASVLERLFGTPFSESKIEFWDAEKSSTVIKVPPSLKDPKKPPFWCPKRCTYVDQSVAINPETGTAFNKKLFHYEVVPPGMSFKLTIAGQNIVYIELGMLLFGLYAFNSSLWPLTLGAMSNRGFGRFRFHLNTIRYLDKNDVSDWVREAVNRNHAGYFSFQPLEKKDADDHIEHFKEAFLKATGGGR